MKEVLRYSQVDYPMKLRVPEGRPFVRADSAEDIREALANGQAAFVESSNGRAFVWRDGAKYRVDQFFFGPANNLDFDWEDEAVDYAASFCD